MYLGLIETIKVLLKGAEAVEIAIPNSNLYGIYSLIYNN
jgi:hypothetical protein